MTQIEFFFLAKWMKYANVDNFHFLLEPNGITRLVLKQKKNLQHNHIPFDN